MSVCIRYKTAPLTTQSITISDVFRVAANNNFNIHMIIELQNISFYLMLRPENYVTWIEAVDKSCYLFLVDYSLDVEWEMANADKHSANFRLTTQLYTLSTQYIVWILPRNNNVMTG